MTTRFSNQRGFAVLEVIMGVLLLVAIGAAGYFAYQDHQNKTPTVSQSATKSTSSSQPASSTDAQHTQTAVDTRLEAIYAAYRNAGTDENTNLNQLSSSGDVTSAFMTNYQNNPEPDALNFGCGNGIQPSSITPTMTTISGNRATVVVNGVHNTAGDDGSTSAFATYILVYANGTWAVDSRTCAPGAS